jgi:hypothetical protein
MARVHVNPKLYILTYKPSSGGKTRQKLQRRGLERQVCIERGGGRGVLKQVQKERKDKN